MNDRYKWSVALGLALILAAFVGMWSYDLGMSHAMVESSRIAAVQPGQPVPYVYVWPRPWGFGFGFPLFFLLFWFVILRAFLWRGPWRGGGYRYRDLAMFDDWHRRAHEEMAKGKG
jgi:hypothetical protein